MMCMSRTGTAGGWAAGGCPEGVEGIARFHELAAAHANDPGQVVIGIETDRGLFVAALVAAGYLVFAVNPMSTSRYRDRHWHLRGEVRSRRCEGAGGHGPHRPS